jgi:hypothetical protein
MAAGHIPPVEPDRVVRVRRDRFGGRLVGFSSAHLCACKRIPYSGLVSICSSGGFLDITNATEGIAAGLERRRILGLSVGIRVRLRGEMSVDWGDTEYDMAG